MKLRTTLLLLCATSLHVSYADALAPEIAPRVAKYEADSKTLDSGRTAATARILQDYLRFLDAADKTASTSGKTEELAAILKAREAATSLDRRAKLPTTASKALQKRHEDYVAALAVVDRDFGARLQQTNATYLRDLASIESRLPTSSPTRAQIADIKAKLALGVGKGALSGVGEIVGTWKLTYPGGTVGILEFFPDHTWKHPKDRTADKKWRVDDDKLIMEFPDGGREWFYLPIDPKGTKGATGRGVKFTAVRQEP